MYVDDHYHSACRVAKYTNRGNACHIDQYELFTRPPVQCTAIGALVMSTSNGNTASGRMILIIRTFDCTLNSAVSD